MTTKEELEDVVKKLEDQLILQKERYEKLGAAGKDVVVQSSWTEKKFPKFKEDDDIDDWIRTIHYYIDKKFKSAQEKVDFILEHLDKKTKTEVRFRINPIKASAKEAQQDFYDRNQKSDENLKEYSHVLMNKLVTLEKLNAQIFKDADMILKQRFATGVENKHLKRELKRLVDEQKSLNFHQLRQRAET